MVIAKIPPADYRNNGKRTPLEGACFKYLERDFVPVNAERIMSNYHRRGI